MTGQISLIVIGVTWFRRNGYESLLSLSLGEPFLRLCRRVDDAYRSRTYRVHRSHIYVCDYMWPPCSGVKRMVPLTLLAVARMVVWTTRMDETLRYEHYFHQVWIVWALVQNEDRS